MSTVHEGWPEGDPKGLSAGCRVSPNEAPAMSEARVDGVLDLAGAQGEPQ